MADLLDPLGELEGHEFMHAGQVYTVVTVTWNRTPLGEATKGDEPPVHVHFTVTTPSRAVPLGLELKLRADAAADMAYVRDQLEHGVRSILGGERPPG